MIPSKSCGAFGFALVAALGLFAPTAARAASPITLFNTGVDSTGTPLPNGTVGDSHFSMTSVPLGSSSTPAIRTSAGGFPIQPSGPWVGDDGVSTWIGPSNDAFLDGPSGNYTYETTFTLPAAGTVNITGQWAAANSQGFDILLNGISQSAPSASYVSFTPFGFSGAGLSGLNTLDFLVGNTTGPTGLRVEFSSATVDFSTPVTVPEPASLTILGLGAMGLLMRRRKF
jgi:hypothetical protein